MKVLLQKRLISKDGFRMDRLNLGEDERSCSEIGALAEKQAIIFEKEGSLEIAYFAWEEAFKAYKKGGVYEKMKECQEHIARLKETIFKPFENQEDLDRSFMLYLRAQVKRKGANREEDSLIGSLPEKILFQERLWNSIKGGDKRIKLIGLSQRFGLTLLETEVIYLLFHMETNPFLDKQIKGLFHEEYLYYPSVNTIRRFLLDERERYSEIFQMLEPSSRIVRLKLVEIIPRDPVTILCRLDRATFLYLADGDEKACILASGLNTIEEYDNLPETAMKQSVCSSLKALGMRGKLGIFGPKPLIIGDLRKSQIPCLFVRCSNKEEAFRTMSLARLLDRMPVIVIDPYIKDKTKLTDENEGDSNILPIEEMLISISKMEYPCIVVCPINLENECIIRVESIVAIEYPKPDQLQMESFVRYCLRGKGFSDVKEEVVKTILSNPFCDLEGIEESVTAWVSFSKGINDIEAARRIARSFTSRLFLGIAEHIKANVGWQDLVLPDETLITMNEIITFARYRERVMFEYGFAEKMPYGHALTVLFSGPPGTGKTLAACVIANDLNVDCYRVDLSQVVSKWVGETEKNLARVFDVASHTKALLLFDEADSLFGKRTEVKTAVDRYANLEVNYLLQRLEEFDGVCILTTNNPEAIDPAFKRRIRFKVSFPFPDVNMRTQLWQVLIPKKVPIDGKIQYEKLASEFELSGAQIRNAILRATFMAVSEERGVSQADLMEAAKKEAKEAGILVRG